MLKVYYMYVIAVFNNMYGVTGVDIITSEYADMMAYHNITMC